MKRTRIKFGFLFGLGILPSMEWNWCFVKESENELIFRLTMREEKWYNKLFNVDVKEENITLQDRRLEIYNLFKKNRLKSEIKTTQKKQK